MDSIDLLNEAESFLVAWFTADPDVAATTIQESIKVTLKSFQESKLPYIGINCTKLTLDPTEDMVDIDGNCTFVCKGTNANNTTDTKKLASQIFRSLNKTFVPGYSRADYLVDMQAVFVEIEPIKGNDSSFRTIGYAEFVMRVNNMKSLGIRTPA